MKEHDLYQELTNMVDSAFNKHFKEKKNMENNTQPQTSNNQATAQSKAKYQTIEEYSQATGKRFRMTKEQAERNISREEAFREFIGKIS